MKGPKDLKLYVSRFRKHLRACHWDDLYVMKLQSTCRKWYKRNKRISDEERE